MAQRLAKREPMISSSSSASCLPVQNAAGGPSYPTQFIGLKRDSTAHISAPAQIVAQAPASRWQARAARRRRPRHDLSKTVPEAANRQRRLESGATPSFFILACRVV